MESLLFYCCCSILLYIYRILSFIDIVLGFVIGFFFYIFFVCVFEWDALDFREVVKIGPEL